MVQGRELVAAIQTGKILEEDNILAVNVDFETYLNEYADQSTEWVEGVVISLSPVSQRHVAIVHFLIRLFEDYLEETKEGRLLSQPFAMQISDKRTREPDICFVKNEHLDRLQATLLTGAADLVIEVVSLESIQRDKVTKFREYEGLGVQEYWIIDPLEQKTSFYILDETGKYHAVQPDDEGFYKSYVLDAFRFPVNIFHRDPLPNKSDIGELIKEMLGK